jgi:hypothetical protein
MPTTPPITDEIPRVVLVPKDVFPSCLT